MLISKTKVEVRYAETDQMGVVHHSRYLVWCEVGRGKLVESLGFSYVKLEEQGFLAPVTEVKLHYKHAVRYGETVEIHTWIDDYDGIRAIYGYEIVNEKEEVCVTGTTTHVVVDRTNFRPRSMRKALPDWHEVYTREKAEQPHFTKQS